MKINKKYKLEKAVFDDAIRPAMQCILLKNNKAVATNGHILVEVPVEGHENDKEILIDMEEWKFIQNSCKEFEYGKRNGKIKKLDTGSRKFEIENDTLKGEKYVMLYRNTITEKYPNYEVVKPKADDTVVFEIAFNPALLNDLIQAMGIKKGESAIFKFYGKTKPIVVTSNASDSNNEYGLLMPVRIND